MVNLKSEMKLNNNCKLRDTKLPTVMKSVSCETQTCAIQTDSFLTGLVFRDTILGKDEVQGSGIVETKVRYFLYLVSWIH